VKYLNSSEKFEDCCTPPLLEHHETSIVESACTGHFLLINAPFQSKVKSIDPLRVCLPNGNTMDSTHTSSLDIPELRQAASMAHVCPGMENHSLLSVGQYFNDLSEAGGVEIGHSQHVNTGYAKIFATGNFMSACHRWGDKGNSGQDLGQFQGSLLCSSQPLQAYARGINIQLRLPCSKRSCWKN
jgi:hypothetical protein